MKHYELLYIVPVKFAGPELDNIQNKVKDIIAKEGAQIDYEENLGKKRLAYQIKHNFQGFYIINEFNAEPEKLKAINNRLTLLSEILRHLIIAQEPMTQEERAKQKQQQMSQTRTDKKDETSMAGQFNIESQLEPEIETIKTVITEPEQVVEVKEIIVEKPVVVSAEEDKVVEPKEKEEKKSIKKDTSKEDFNLDETLNKIINSEDLF